jgi:hypothetical protein
MFTTGSGAAIPPPSQRAMDAAVSFFNETDRVDEAGTRTKVESVEQPTTPLVQSSLARALALFEDSSPSAASASDPAPSFQPPMHSTPSRTPLRTTTNTFRSLRPVRRQIEIKTPAIRRIGLGGTPQSRGKRGFVAPFKRGAAPRAVVATPNEASGSRFERVFDLTREC